MIKKIKKSKRGKKKINYLENKKGFLDPGLGRTGPRK